MARSQLSSSANSAPNMFISGSWSTQDFGISASVSAQNIPTGTTFSPASAGQNTARVAPVTFGAYDAGVNDGNMVQPIDRAQACLSAESQNPSVISSFPTSVEGQNSRPEGNSTNENFGPSVVAQFGAGVADDDFLRVAGTVIEGRSASEVLSDIGATTATLAANEATALAIALG